MKVGTWLRTFGSAFAFRFLVCQIALIGSLVPAASFAYADQSALRMASAQSHEVLKLQPAVVIRLSSDTSAYILQWPRVKGAVRYRITAQVTPLAGKSFVDSRTAVLASVPQNDDDLIYFRLTEAAVNASVSGGALLDPGLGLTAVLVVTALDSAGQRIWSDGAWTPCPYAALISERGTGQNPEQEAGVNLGGWKGGVGDVGHQLWLRLRSRMGLGMPAFRILAGPAIAYPNLASTLQGLKNQWEKGDLLKPGATFNYVVRTLADGAAYFDSVDYARNELVRTVKRARKQCPKTVLFLSGYSQGAHVVGDVAQAIDDFDQTVLFADPMQNKSDVDVQYPPASRGGHDANGFIAQALRPVGGAGPREPFADPKKVSSWCWLGDAVCVGSVANVLQAIASRADSHFHTDGDRDYYKECYIDGAAMYALNGLVVAGRWPGSKSNLDPPSCEYTI